METKISDTQLTLKAMGVGRHTKWFYVDYTAKAFQNWRHSRIQERMGI